MKSRKVKKNVKKYLVIWFLILYNKNIKVIMRFQ